MTLCTNFLIKCLFRILRNEGCVSKKLSSNESVYFHFWAGVVHPGFLDMSEACRTHHPACGDDAGASPSYKFLSYPEKLHSSN